MQLPNPGERKSCTNNLNNTKCTQTEKELGHPTAIPMTKSLAKNQVWKSGGGTPYPWQDGREEGKSELASITVYPSWKLAAHLVKGLYLLEPYPVLKLFTFTQTNAHWAGGAQGTDVYCKVVPTLYKSGSCAQFQCNLLCHWNDTKKHNIKTANI